MLSNIQWGWTLTSVTTEGVATLTINKINLQFLYFSFLQIGAYGSVS